MQVAYRKNRRVGQSWHSEYLSRSALSNRWFQSAAFQGRDT
jgi:hypothetical protein